MKQKTKNNSLNVQFFPIYKMTPFPLRGKIGQLRKRKRVLCCWSIFMISLWSCTIPEGRSACAWSDCQPWGSRRLRSRRRRGRTCAAPPASAPPWTPARRFRSSWPSTPHSLLGSVRSNVISYNLITIIIIIINLISKD